MTIQQRIRRVGVLVLAFLTLAGCGEGCQTERVKEARNALHVLKSREARARQELKQELGDEFDDLGKDLVELKKFAGDPQLEARSRSARNLLRIAAALRTYHDEHGRFPPHAHLGESGKPLLSWRVLILPQLGEEELFKQFILDESWDGPHNAKLLSQMPAVFAPTGIEPEAPFVTYYKVFTGPDTPFAEEGVSLDQIADGPTSTYLVVESGSPSPWTKPEDLVYAVDLPLPRLGYLAGGFLAVTAAGTLQCFMGSQESELGERTLRAWITPTGRERLSSGGGFD